MNKNNNPAFAIPFSTYEDFQGFSKREYAAIHIFASLNLSIGTLNDNEYRNDAVSAVVKAADALMRKLEETKVD